MDEIARLNKETTEVCQERLGQALGADQWMHLGVEEKLKVFDDPVFADDGTVKQKKVELQTSAEGFRNQWATFQSQLDFLVKHVAETSLQKVVDAKRKADDEARAASAAAEVAKKPRAQQMSQKRLRTTRRKSRKKMLRQQKS